MKGEESLRASAIIEITHPERGIMAIMKFVVNKDLAGETVIKNKVIDADTVGSQPNSPFTRFMKGDKPICLINTDLIKTIDVEY